MRAFATLDDADIKNKRVLAGCLDNNPRFADIGYYASFAPLCDCALAAIAKQRPDLILMDIQLPIMDGYTATSKIKADPALRSIPIIAVTSYALSGEDKDCSRGRL
jgi:CheY-like chemotaxis protein